MNTKRPAGIIYSYLIGLLLLSFISGCGQKPVRTLKGHTGAVITVAFSPDGTMFLTGSEDGTARLWKTATGEFIDTIVDLTPVQFLDAVFLSDGSHVLVSMLDTSSYNSQACLINVTGESDSTTSCFVKTGYSLALSPDGKQFLSDSGSVIILHDIYGVGMRDFDFAPDRLLSVDFSPDGHYAVTGSADATALLWDVATGKTLKTYKGHTDKIWSVAFSPDGKYVITGSWDTTAKLWDATTDQIVRTFSGHSDGVVAVAFSPDGKYVLTGSLDKTARVWDIATGKVVRTLSGHSDAVLSVAFSPDGKYILTGSSDKTARLWNFRP